MTFTTQIVEPSELSRPSPEVAPDLLGCSLVRQMPNGEILRGLIVETEAYAPGDPAFHAYKRPTKRNKVLFGQPGRSYVYLIYGLYHCFNIVTDTEGVPSAVLLRAVQLESFPGIENSQLKKLHRLAAGPGKLCQILAIDRSLNDIPLQPNQGLWLEHRHPTWQQQLDAGNITLIQTTRIGITQGQELPWRWYIHNCPAVSKP